ncbi:hypothetical protein I4U23_000133 [Adineta vaga]|nr:hypothetical protein I4U23_000133 [Adineta vaga]
MANEDREIDMRKQYRNTTASTAIRQDSIIDLWANVDPARLAKHIHAIPISNLFQHFHTNPNTGLSINFVPEARAQYGNNKITPPKSPNYFWLLFKQLFMGFNLILWLAGILAFIAYQPLGGPTPSITNLALGIVIFLVITCNAILNVYQEMKSIKIVASFSRLVPNVATVRRDGVEQQIAAEEIVPGDIILIRMGSKLPADCRFLICDGLKVNASELTGESKPVTVTVETTSQNFMESANVGYYSSLVEQGTGEAVVIATGDNTVLGKMSRITRDHSGDEITGLQREVNRFVFFIFVATIIAISILWVTWGVWLQYFHSNFVTLTGNILNSIGMIVGFLPVGLPSAITLVLTIAAKRMYQQRILGKSLHIAETLNFVSVVATDKTGTLTVNKMTVTNILWDTEGEYKVIDNVEEEQIKKASMRQTIQRPSPEARHIIHHGIMKVAPITERSSSEITNQSHFRSSFCCSNRESSELDIQNELKIEVFRDLLLGAALCNDAEKQLVQDTQFSQDTPSTDSELCLVGDAVDVALYNLCVNRCHMEIDEIRSLNPRLKILPFNSSNKFMISANQLESRDMSSSKSESTILITMKGAPDIVIERCSSYKTNDDQILPLTDQVKETLYRRQEMLGKRGYRVIAMCQQRFTQQQYDHMTKQSNIRQCFTTVNDEDLNGFPSNNYCFIGIFSLLDPPRADVAESILRLHRAYIRTLMITGDHPTTAKAIARQVNIFSSAISEKNGVDTFQIGQNANGHLAIRLYRNQTLLQLHVTGRSTPFTIGSKATRAVVKQIETNTNKNDHMKEASWYKQFYSSFKQLFSEPESAFNKHPESKMIPYAIVVTGSQIDFLDDFMWYWILSHQELVFARTSPEQKLRIIMEFQRRGETVAFIGDGTNDALSLKCADLGIAMQSGTKVSKEASDMILLDNNFSSVVRAIKTGRLLSDNLKKTAIYLMPGGSWSEIWPVFFNMWFGMPLGISAFLSTILCMLNDLLISLAMVTEKAETHIMSRRPSVRKNDHLLNLKLLTHAYLFVGNFECSAAFFCYCYYWIDNGVPFYSFMFTFEKFGINPPLNYSSNQLNEMTNVAQSTYYCSLCIFQIFNFFATRTRYTSILQHNPIWGKGQNLYGFIAIIISIGIQLILTQIPWFNQIFGTAPVPVKYVMPAIGFGMLWLLIDEFRKFCIRKFPHGIAAKIAW